VLYARVPEGEPVYCTLKDQCCEQDDEPRKNTAIRYLDGGADNTTQHNEQSHFNQCKLPAHTFTQQPYNYQYKKVNKQCAYKHFE